MASGMIQMGLRSFENKVQSLKSISARFHVRKEAITRFTETRLAIQSIPSLGVPRARAGREVI